MADTRAHLIAQALFQLAQSLAPGRREEEPAGGAARIGAGAKALPRGDVDGLAALVRALCPPTADTTDAADVASFIRALCPPTASTTDAASVARLIQALSPADEPGGRARLAALIAALSPVEPEQRISELTDVFVRGDADKVADAVAAPEEQLRSALLSLARGGGSEGGQASSTAKLTPRQRQAVEVFRALSPVAQQPKTSVEEAVALLRQLSPGARPAEEVAGLIAALSPASDRTVSSVQDAVKFIRALCPAGNVPATDVAHLVRALSPADDRAARRTTNVAELIRALCPAGGEPTAIAALIRALSPADDAASRPTEIAKLIRELSPADITAVDVIRTLSPATSAD